MTIEDQITALLAQAEPLRLLPDVEAEAKGLPRIVDAINALRAAQSSGSYVREIEVAPHVDTSPAHQAVVSAIASEPEPLPARRPGRPRKTPAEGADA